MLFARGWPQITAGKAGAHPAGQATARKREKKCRSASAPSDFVWPVYAQIKDLEIARSSVPTPHRSQATFPFLLFFGTSHKDRVTLAFSSTIKEEHNLDTSSIFPKSDKELVTVGEYIGVFAFALSCAWVGRSLTFRTQKRL